MDLIFNENILQIINIWINNGLGQNKIDEIGKQIPCALEMALSCLQRLVRVSDIFDEFLGTYILVSNNLIIIIIKCIYKWQAHKNYLIWIF